MLKLRRMFCRIGFVIRNREPALYFKRSMPFNNLITKNSEVGSGIFSICKYDLTVEYASPDVDECKQTTRWYKRMGAMLGNLEVYKLYNKLPYLHDAIYGFFRY